jgi:hypothetical protein
VSDFIVGLPADGDGGDLGAQGSGLVAGSAAGQTKKTPEKSLTLS